MVLRILFCTLFITFCHQSLLAQSDKLFEGNKVDGSTIVDPNVEGLYIGPFFPDDVLSNFKGQFTNEYYSFNYRVVISRAEIFENFFIDLLATWGENDRVLISSYTIPDLYGFIKVDFIKWNSWNSFKVLLSSLKDDYEADITILQNGKFSVSKNLIKKTPE